MAAGGSQITPIVATTWYEYECECTMLDLVQCCGRRRRVGRNFLAIHYTIVDSDGVDDPPSYAKQHKDFFQDTK